MAFSTKVKLAKIIFIYKDVHERKKKKDFFSSFWHGENLIGELRKRGFFAAFRDNCAIVKNYVRDQLKTYPDDVAELEFFENHSVILASYTNDCNKSLSQ